MLGMVNISVDNASSVGATIPPAGKSVIAVTITLTGGSSGEGLALRVKSSVSPISKPAFISTLNPSAAPSTKFVSMTGAVVMPDKIALAGFDEINCFSLGAFDGAFLITVI